MLLSLWNWVVGSCFQICCWVHINIYTDATVLLHLLLCRSSFWGSPQQTTLETGCYENLPLEGLKAEGFSPWRIQIAYSVPQSLTVGLWWKFSTRETWSFEKHMSLWQIITSAQGLWGKWKCKLHILFFPVCSLFVCSELYFISNAMHAHTDNWHFKSITLDKATWTNESKRQDDLLGEWGWRNILIYFFFQSCLKWIWKIHTPPLRQSMGAVSTIAWWPEIR